MSDQIGNKCRCLVQFPLYKVFLIKYLIILSSHAISSTLFNIQLLEHRRLNKKNFITFCTSKLLSNLRELSLLFLFYQKDFPSPFFFPLLKQICEQYQCTGRNHKPLGNFNTQSKSNGAFLQKVSRGTLKDALTRCELSTFGIVDLTHETIC